MSKIEEMAEKYAQEAYSNPVDRNVGKADFIAGANAVLKEIEKILVAANEQYTTKQAVALNTEIYNKIRELKGE